MIIYAQSNTNDYVRVEATFELGGTFISKFTMKYRQVQSIYISKLQ